ncbi:MAG TPA: phosphotransferase [Solirubrobacteraceae bacterium]|nr:phosphotransferase [Solirubrobacteraceae bacterium]
MHQLDAVLEQLQTRLGPLEGEPRPLSGGITNRNFRVRLGGGEYVVRLPGERSSLLGIDRSAERLAGEAAAALGIGPPVFEGAGGCLVTEFIEGGPVEAGEPAQRAPELGRALRAFHDCAVQLPVDFSVVGLLEQYAATVHAGGGELPGDYATARSVAARITAALGGVSARPCHNDLLAANIIRSEHEGRLMIVDWEYAGMGDPRFDLGNLAVNNDFGDADEERLLLAYHGSEPDDAMRASVKLMRVLSDAREAAWGVVQSVLSELDFDFDGYAREHFERLSSAAAAPDFEEWLAAAGG